MTKKGVKQVSNKLVYGVGINDVDYPVTRTGSVGGKYTIVWKCPYYTKWSGIIERCYSKRMQEKHPTYKGCTMDSAWLLLSNFIKWVDSQPNRDWMNCEPDKDILFSGNKHYGPETVVFIPHKLNSFIVNDNLDNPLKQTGVCYEKKSKKFRASCANPFEPTSSKKRFIGYFECHHEAHMAWKRKKHEYACMLADIQDDSRVADALRARYL